MNSLAKRLDPCLNWFKLLARTKGRILWLFPAVLFAAYALAVLMTGNPFYGLQEHSSQLRANAPLLAEARSLNLDYEQVLAKPESYVGKPVVWCVNGETESSGFVDSRMTQWITWTPPMSDLKSGRGAYGYCWKVLAVIEGAERGGVKLRIIEKL